MIKESITIIIVLALQLVVIRGVSAQQIYCAPNSLPRSCGGYSVCTVLGNCGFLQDINCCVTTGGFPTNTPTGVPPPAPTPTNLPTFPPPSATPSPTPSYFYNQANAWFSADLGEGKEVVEAAITDAGGQYAYLVGRKMIGVQNGWEQSGLGFILKVSLADKSVVWQKEIGSYLGYQAGGLYDIKIDGSGIYISGYEKWGKNLYVSKISPTTGDAVWVNSAQIDTYWSLDKGSSLELDDSYAYVVSSTHDGQGPDNPNDKGSNSRWVVHKISKSNGSVASTRSVQITTGDDNPVALIPYNTYLYVIGETSGRLYAEILNKSNLQTVLSVTSEYAKTYRKSVIIDRKDIYITFILNPGQNQQVAMQRRSVTKLALNTQKVIQNSAQGQSNTKLINIVNTTKGGVMTNHTKDGLGQNYGAKYMGIDRLDNLVLSGGADNGLIMGGIGTIGDLFYGANNEVLLAGAKYEDQEIAIYKVNDLLSTPTPTPTMPMVAGCSPVIWTSQNNITASGNSFFGTTYPEWNFENGADANFSSDTDIGGYAEIPQVNPNYGAMWGLSSTSSPSDWVDYAWYAPYYSSSDMYVMLPGRRAIPMGSSAPGDRFLVQKSGQKIIFARASSGSSEWQVLYSLEGDISSTYEFRGRVSGYSQIYRAHAGNSCQPAPVPTSMPYPTLAPNAVIQPWYLTNQSSYPEFGYAAYPDSNGEHVYLVGRKDIGKPFGWHQSSLGFIQKIRVSDKSVVWEKEVGGELGTYNGGLHDVRVDGDDLYVTGYVWWGTDLYVEKINKNTGATIWKKEDNLGWSWLPWKGLDFDIDTDYLYIASNTTESDQDADMLLTKKRKTDGTTVATRRLNLSSNDWDGYTNVIQNGNYLYVSGYREYDKPNWYIEKLNKNDLSLVTSVTGVEGIIDMHGMVTDGVYLYIGGFQKIAGGTMWASSLKTQVHIEKRRLSDLALIWSYNTPQTDRLQGSVALTLYNGEVLITANDSIDRVGWFGSSWLGSNLRFVRINKDTGQELFSGLYNGVGNVGSIEKDVNGTIYLAGATANTDRTAIFRINDILSDQPAEPFGISVKQTLVGSAQRGAPVTINVDIENDSFATQAAWAFEFLNQVPTTIIGVTWTCNVLDYGFAKGDMYEYETRCGAVSSGAGNTVQFSHSSQADPLIHPGGKIRVTINGVVAPNAPASISNMAQVRSYVGWPDNHFYTMNFMSSPLDYVTIMDDDTSDNVDSLVIPVSSSSTPTPNPGLSTTITPTQSPIPTPTTPASVLNMCLDENQILRLSIDGATEYYCEDNDPTGHNLILIKNNIPERLNSQDVAIENVNFEWGDPINGYRLITISFDGKPRSGLVARRSAQTRKYKSTIRVKSN